MAARIRTLEVPFDGDKPMLEEGAAVPGGTVVRVNGTWAVVEDPSGAVFTVRELVPQVA